MKIIIDAFGGDNSPLEIIKGTVDALLTDSKLEVVLVGKEDVIKKHLSDLNYNGDRIELINADDVIENCESPALAVRRKPNSSIVVAFKNLKERDDIGAFVSAGSSGAVLSGALLILGRAEGVLRPTLMSTFPTITGGKVLLTDCGANLDTKPEYLSQFALMANIYAKSFLKIENPRVVLLNVGEEEGKGDERAKIVYEDLKKLPINFCGNMEARDYMSGKADIIVSDGFSGNILMKGAEGTGLSFMKLVKEAIYGNFVSKIGGLLLKKNLKKMKNLLDYSNYGGALFLGCNKMVCKCHGSSKAKSIKVAILETNEIVKSDVANKIKDEIARTISSSDIKE